MVGLTEVRSELRGVSCVRNLWEMVFLSLCIFAGSQLGYLFH